VLYGLAFVVGVVFAQGGENDVSVDAARFFFELDCIHVVFKDNVDYLVVDFATAVYKTLAAGYGSELACGLVDDFLIPHAVDLLGYAASFGGFEIGACGLDFLAEVEHLEDVAVTFESDGAQQGGYGQLLFTVDVGIHRVVDVSGKLNPASSEGNDSG